jgi:hypothetical protein
MYLRELPVLVFHEIENMKETWKSAKQDIFLRGGGAFVDFTL